MTSCCVCDVVEVTGVDVVEVTDPRCFCCEVVLVVGLAVVEVRAFAICCERANVDFIRGEIIGWVVY